MTFVSMILAIIVIGGLLVYINGTKPKSKSTSSSSDSSGDGSTTQPALDRDFVQRHWAEISQMQGAGGAGLKNALIEADKLLDYIMLAKGFKGDTMGERLKQNGGQFSDLNSIWSAHKLRNKYAHEVHIDVVPREIEVAIRQLGQGIKDLGVQL